MELTTNFHLVTWLRMGGDKSSRLVQGQVFVIRQTNRSQFHRPLRKLQRYALKGDEQPDSYLPLCAGKDFPVFIK